MDHRSWRGALTFATVTTIIIVLVAVAGIHLHDSWLQHTSADWISGPMADFARYHGPWWEVGVLTVIGLMTFSFCLAAARPAAATSHSKN